MFTDKIHVSLPTLYTIAKYQFTFPASASLMR